MATYGSAGVIPYSYSSELAGTWEAHVAYGDIEKMLDQLSSLLASQLVRAMERLRGLEAEGVAGQMRACAEMMALHDALRAWNETKVHPSQEPGTCPEQA